ncbi:hypothetical protein BJY52DRAFT_1226064 [Lactarius psammicola]|nr:hypothetical protein BJY52DRAFT_1226064 [Lactarius psammicola]
MAIQLDVASSPPPIVKHVGFRLLPLSQLPVELLDLIASFVATHCDLISLALTCRALAHIVIPAHAAYRTIRVRSQRGPAPWVTIAARPDRAAGSEEGRFLPERTPSIALGPAASSVKPGRAGRGVWKAHSGRWSAETLEAAASAVRVMPNLHTLVFSGTLRRGRERECRATETRFWAAVAGTHGSLRRLEYAQSPTKYMAEVQMYPLWSVSNLTSFSVKHVAFLRHPPSVVQFSNALRNSPSLKSLTLAVRDPTFDLRALLHDVCFPHLRALVLDILAPEAPANARTLAMLLERTPKLQHAVWRHIDPDALSTGALPALRTLHVEEVPCSPGVAGRALLRGGAALDALGSVCVDEATVETLAHMRGEVLRRLEVASFESIAVLVRAVRLFPCLRLLRLPAVDYWHEHSPVTPAPVHLGEWVEVLAALPELEVFRGVSIFRNPESTTIEENDERAYDILSLCPRMRQVEHWDLDPGRAIALVWEGDRAVWRVEDYSRADGNRAWVPGAYRSPYYKGLFSKKSILQTPGARVRCCPTGRSPIHAN